MESIVARSVAPILNASSALYRTVKEKSKYIDKVRILSSLYVTLKFNPK